MSKTKPTSLAFKQPTYEYKSKIPVKVFSDFTLGEKKKAFQTKSNFVHIILSQATVKISLIVGKSISTMGY